MDFQDIPRDQCCTVDEEATELSTPGLSEALDASETYASFKSLLSVMLDQKGIVDEEEEGDFKALFISRLNTIFFLNGFTGLKLIETSIFCQESAIHVTSLIYDLYKEGYIAGDSLENILLELHGGRISDLIKANISRLRSESHEEIFAELL